MPTRKKRRVRRDPDGNELPVRMLYQRGRYYRTARDIEGKQRWTWLGTDFRQALQRWAVQEAGPAQAETFRQVVDAYMSDDEVLSRLAPATVRAYRGSMERLVDVFGHQRLEHIRPREVDEYRRRRSAPRAAARELMLMGLIYRYARARGWWDSLEAPSDGLRRAPTRQRSRVATPEEIAALLAAASPLWQTIVEFALLTGARVGEIRSLRRDALTPGGIVLTRQKTGRDSIIRWSPTLRACVERALALHPSQRPNLHVFPSRRGPYSYRGFNLAWRQLRDAAGCPDLKFHDLRRTAATHAGDLEHARALLGHTDQKVTGRVYRVLDEVDPTR